MILNIYIYSDGFRGIGSAVGGAVERLQVIQFHRFIRIS
jgi:hypothetical protein